MRPTQERPELFDDIIQDLVNTGWIKPGEDVEILRGIFDKYWDNGYAWGQRDMEEMFK